MKTTLLVLVGALAIGQQAWGPAFAYDQPEFPPLEEKSPLQSKPANTDAKAKQTKPTKTVCTMTINSQDEIKAFQRRLRANQPGSRFKFVELTKMGTADTWWRNVGRSGIQCDILLVSAHFGGDLFGDNTRIRLSLSELEEASCNNTHDGVLKNPKEVFLFTCNMLAGKQRDVRTPRQYYQVLLHYYPPDLAQYYVQTRYGAWGGTFVGRTTRAFYGVPRLYGYDSVSPLGKDSGAWVERYLSQIADYGRHLDRVKPNTRNMTLIRTIGYTGMIQKTGVLPGTLGDKVRTNLCKYFNAGSTSGKLAVLARVLHEKKFEPYLTYVEEFYRKHKPRYGAAHADIKGNARVKNHVLRLIDVSVDMPHTRIDLVNFASHVGWISGDQRTAYLEKIVRDLFAGATTADKVFDVCSVGRRHRSFVGQYVNLKFLESVKPSSQWDYRYLEMVGCLRPQGEALQNKVAEYLDPDKHAWKYRWAAAYTFLDTKPRTEYVRKMLVKAAYDKHRAVRETARQAAKNWKLKAPPPTTRKKKVTPATPSANRTRPLGSPPNTARPRAPGANDVPRTTPDVNEANRAPATRANDTALRFGSVDNGTR